MAEHNQQGDPRGTPTNEQRQLTWVGYAATLLLETMLTAGLLALKPYFPLSHFPIFYVLLIMLIAYFFGEGPAILAFIIGYSAFDYFFVPPLMTIWPPANTIMGWAALTAYLTGAIIAGYLTVLMRHSRREIQRLLIQAEKEIADRKQVEAALRESQSDLNRAQVVAKTGSWRMDVRHNELLWSDETYRIFGIPKGTPLTYEKFLASIHPDDKEYVDRKWKAAIRGEPYDIEHRIRVGDRVKWVRETAELEFDEKGVLLGGFGTVQDITERKLAEERERQSEAEKTEFYRRTIFAATEGKLVITDREEIYQTAGEQIASWKLKNPHEVVIIRHDIRELARVSGMEENRVDNFVLAAGEALTNVYKHAGGGEASMHRLPDGLMLVVTDQGPGIPSLALPDIALARGYSTAGTLGMGYKLMISIADRIYLMTEPGGTTVGLVMGFQPPEKPPLGLSSLGAMLAT